MPTGQTAQVKKGGGPTKNKNKRSAGKGDHKEKAKDAKDPAQSSEAQTPDDHEGAASKQRLEDGDHRNVPENEENMIDNNEGGDEAAPGSEAMAAQEEIELPTEVEQDLGQPSSSADQTDIPQDKAVADDNKYDDLDPKDYGIEFDEEDSVYEPPGMDEDLPDLYNLLDSLDHGESDLEAADEPPSLFTRPEHVGKYKKISELKLQLEEEAIEPYIERFDDGIKDDVLMIGSISLEEVQEEERRLRDEHIHYQDQEARNARQRKQEVLLREEQAKKRLAHEVKDKRKLLKRRQEILLQRERLMLDRIHKAFRRSENHLVSVLEDKKEKSTD